MSGAINVRELPVGTRLVLASGATAEVVSNPGDGVWIFGRFLTSADDPAMIGQEDMIFAQDVVEVQAAGD
jgi:hypothetical protein